MGDLSLVRVTYICCAHSAKKSSFQGGGLSAKCMTPPPWAKNSTKQIAYDIWWVINSSKKLYLFYLYLTWFYSTNCLIGLLKAFGTTLWHCPELGTRSQCHCRYKRPWWPPGGCGNCNGAAFCISHCHHYCFCFCCRSKIFLLLLLVIISRHHCLLFCCLLFHCLCCHCFLLFHPIPFDSSVFRLLQPLWWLVWVWCAALGGRSGHIEGAKEVVQRGLSLFSAPQYLKSKCLVPPIQTIVILSIFEDQQFFKINT